jgi:DNA-binding CsgD family transcriptional regulator
MSGPRKSISPTDDLDRGRDAHGQQAWGHAYASLSRAAERVKLDAGDLELLATAAYMLGRDDDYLDAVDQAHRAHLEADEPLRAARCAFWAGLNLLVRGEPARANGWFGRAQRLAEDDCVERGYLLIPVLLRHVATGDDEPAYLAAAEAASIGERFGDRDLVALTVQEQGHALVRLGRVDEGMRLIDETMLAATTGELSPIVTGLIYCNTIAFCQSAYELRRAREWTDAFSRWCERQPEMVAHTGVCLVHRAEILELAGQWERAFEEARRAEERFRQQVPDEPAAGQAAYRQGEVHRLQGKLAEAEAAYRTASGSGWEPQPGLALLRLAQGRSEAAAVSIRRTLAETSGALERLRLLPAAVEILLAAGADEDARAACDEVEQIAAGYGGPMPEAIAAHARGAVELAQGNAQGALVALRRARQAWHGLRVPYELARTRTLAGLACRELGDQDSGALELEAARESFAALGATADLGRVQALLREGAAADSHGLTPRELEVLRLVAAGRSNREIAAELVISEHTAARHVQNILAKLRLRSRTAAGAFAFEHDLV